MQIFIGGQALEVPAHWTVHDVAFLDRCLTAAGELQLRGVPDVGLVAEAERPAASPPPLQAFRGAAP